MPRTKYGWHISFRILEDNPQKPKERVAVEVVDELTAKGYHLRDIMTDALSEFAGKTPQIPNPVDIDTEAIINAVTNRLNNNVNEQMLLLSNTVIALMEKLKAIGFTHVSAGEDDDDDEAIEYALKIANSIKNRGDE